MLGCMAGFRKWVVFVLGSAAYFVLGTAGVIVGTFLFSGPMSGEFHGRISIWFEHLHGEQLFSFRIEGKTDPKWYWLRPYDFAYERVEISCWYPDTLEIEKRTATIDLRSMSYASRGEKGTLSSEILVSWLMRPQGENAMKRSREWSEEMFEWLIRLDRGEVPPARHHTPRIDKPMSIRIQHASLGRGFPWIYCGWFTAWLVFVIHRYRIMFCRPQASTKIVKSS